MTTIILENENKTEVSFEYDNGLPYKERGCSVISVIVDADTDKISALTGRLGKISGISVKAAISKG